MGKSTFASCLCGQEKKAKGSFMIGGINQPAKKRLKLCYMVMQDCNNQLFTESAEEEILLSMKIKDANLREKALADVLKTLNLTDSRELLEKGELIWSGMVNNHKISLEHFFQ